MGSKSRKSLEDPKFTVPGSGSPERNRKAPVVISYLRYSSSAQHGSDSIRRQLQQSQDWAAAHGYAVDESLRDEGVSAFRGGNAKTGALASILKRIERSEIREGSVLIVESLDRLSREEVRKALQQFLAIIDAGLTIVTLTDGKTYSPDKCDMLDLMQSLMIMSRAHEESAVKSHRSKANWDRRRELAKEGKQLLSRKLPCWLKLNGNKILVDKAKANAVRYCFDLALKGYGVGAIVRRLNAEKVKPPAGGERWYTRFVWRLFSERATIGVKQTKKFEGGRRVVVDEISNYYPAVVGQEVYDRVQAMLMSRRNRQYGHREPSDYVNLFHGLLKDPNGSSYTSVNRKKVGIRYLVSMAAWAQKSEPIQYLRAELFELAFIEAFCEKWPEPFRARDDDGGGSEPSKTAELNAVEKQIADIEQQLVELTSPASALRVLSKLEVRREQLAREIREQKLVRSLNDFEKAEEAADRLRVLLTGEATHDERVELAAVIRRYVTSITLKLTPEPGWMAGECVVEARVGNSLMFKFSYENTKHRKIRKIASLKVDAFELV